LSKWQKQFPAESIFGENVTQGALPEQRRWDQCSKAVNEKLVGF
jgi:hypothetical protein